MSTLSDADLDALANTEIRDPIPQETLLGVLTAPPFIPSRSLFNLRDLGAVRGSTLPAGRFYRSGKLDQAVDDPEALAWLGKHVTRVFDMRKPGEREGAPDPEVEGVERVWHAQDGEYPTPQLKDFALAGGRDAWKQQYFSVAMSYGPTIRAVLEHVRDKPSDPILFHCTAGRDRTGVLAGLLLTLAGTAPADVKRDYMLSRVGIEPAREQLMKFALGSLGVTDPETPGFYELVAMRPEYWEAFEEALEARFGGFEGYVTEGLGVSAGDLETIKRNLRS